MSDKDMTKISQGNKKIATRKIPATSKKIFIHSSGLIQLLLFKEILSTNYKILVGVGTGMQDSSFNKIYYHFITFFRISKYVFIKSK